MRKDPLFGGSLLNKWGGEAAVNELFFQHDDLVSGILGYLVFKAMVRRDVHNTLHHALIIDTALESAFLDLLDHVDDQNGHVVNSAAYDGLGSNYILVPGISGGHKPLALGGFDDAGSRLVGDVGKNIGAELQTDQAEADKRIAQAQAEKRRAMAVAAEQEMSAKTQEMRARVVEAEAEVPLAMAEAFRNGRLGVMDYQRYRNIESDTAMRRSIAGDEEPKES